MATSEMNTKSQNQDTLKKPPQKNEKPQSKPISEKRRLQNRQSQKTFREKHRRQKQQLKRIASSQRILAPLPVSPSSWSFEGSPTESSQINGAGTSPSTFTYEEENHNNCTFFSNFHHTSNCSLEDVCHEMPYQTPQTHVYRGYLSHQLNPPNLERSECWDRLPWTDGCANLKTITNYQNVPIFSDRQDAESEEVLSRLLIQTDSQIDQCLLEQIVESQLSISDVLRAGLSVLSSKMRVAGQRYQSMSHRANQPRDCTFEQSELRRRVLPWYRQKTAWLSGMSQGIGSQNSLSLIYMSFSEASAINAAILGMPGIDIDSERDATRPILAFTPESLLNAETKSPFFRSGIRKETAEEMCSTGFANIRLHLRPVVSQLLSDHYAYLDTLPFPRFRERAIGLICSKPPMIDESDFFNDLLNDGLVCWSLDPTKSELGTAASGPWDLRCWEARPWFLKKWWILIGGTQSKIYRQTVWWREMRGETTSDLLPGNYQ